MKFKTYIDDQKFEKIGLIKLNEEETAAIHGGLVLPNVWNETTNWWHSLDRNQKIGAVVGAAVLTLGLCLQVHYIAYPWVKETLYRYAKVNLASVKFEKPSKEQLDEINQLCKEKKIPEGALIKLNESFYKDSSQVTRGMLAGQDLDDEAEGRSIAPAKTFHKLGIALSVVGGILGGGYLGTQVTAPADEAKST